MVSGQSVLEKERKGDYLGKTVQVIRIVAIVACCFLHAYMDEELLLTSVMLIQVVPHITDAIKDWIESVAVIPVDGKEGPADVCVIELGGTVGKFFCKGNMALLKLHYLAQPIRCDYICDFTGDIESMPFIEALRQLSFSVGKFVACFAFKLKLLIQLFPV